MLAHTFGLDALAGLSPKLIRTLQQFC